MREDSGAKDAGEDSRAIVEGKYRREPATAMIGRGMTELTGAPDWVAAWRTFFEPVEVVGIKLNPVSLPWVMSVPEVVQEIGRCPLLLNRGWWIASCAIWKAIAARSAILTNPGCRPRPPLLVSSDSRPPPPASRCCRAPSRSRCTQFQGQDVADCPWSMTIFPSEIRGPGQAAN
jgi:hypothetical protein